MMILGPKVAAAALALHTLGSAIGGAQAAEGAKTCDCKDLSQSFVVTRLWNIIDPDWTDQMVIDEFDRGFAPEVTHLEGFQEYVSAFTNVTDTVFFMNVFESQELAKAAQEGAKLFVQRGVLNGKITPNQFTENELSFFKSSEDCVTETYAEKFIGTHIFTLTDAAITGGLALDEVVNQVEEEFADDVIAMDGFLEYGGSIVTGTDLVFFFLVFDSLDGVSMANDNMLAFVSNSTLDSMIEPVAITAGAVDFDYTCAAGNIPAPFEADGESPDAGMDNIDSASPVSIFLSAGTALVTLATLFF